MATLIVKSLYSTGSLENVYNISTAFSTVFRMYL